MMGPWFVQDFLCLSGSFCLFDRAHGADIIQAFVAIGFRFNIVQYAFREIGRVSAEMVEVREILFRYRPVLDEAYFFWRIEAIA